MRRLLLASLLAGSAWSAHAQPVNWSFTYTGFHSTQTTTHELFGTTTTEAFLPDAQVRGHFRGNDGNGDGILEMAELDSFVVGTIDYVGCGIDESRWMMCDLGYFNYVLDGRELSFFTSWRGNDEAYSGWGAWVASGSQAVDYSYNDYSESRTTWAWTDATRLSFEALSPVPEPATGAMAAAGLVLLAGLRRRKSKVN